MMTISHHEIFFMGRIYDKEGIKHIETYHDKVFLDQWGIGGKYFGQSMIYNQAEHYELTYHGVTQNVIKISYFDPDGTDDPQNSYFEVFLNKNLQSLCWQRYTCNLKSKIQITMDGKIYGLGYQSIPDRLL